MNIQRAIKKCKKEIAKLEDKDNLSIHGFWSLGYWQGRLSALEDMEDEPLMVYSKVMKQKSEAKYIKDCLDNGILPPLKGSD